MGVLTQFSNQKVPYLLQKLEVLAALPKESRARAGAGCCVQHVQGNYDCSGAGTHLTAHDVSVLDFTEF
jgi:hypothetical protein